jgi:hypothetical protein
VLFADPKLFFIRHTVNTGSGTPGHQNGLWNIRMLNSCVLVQEADGFVNPLESEVDMFWGWYWRSVLQIMTAKAIVRCRGPDTAKCKRDVSNEERGTHFSQTGSSYVSASCRSISKFKTICWYTPALVLEAGQSIFLFTGENLQI